MKLKTLKDIKWKDYSIHNMEILDKKFKEIREEAIKWVKRGLKERRNFLLDFLEFHNITEEDLK